MIHFKNNKLTVQVFTDRQSMGTNAASDVAQTIRELLRNKDEINMIFAAAPSQNDFLAELIADSTIEWNRIKAFHMDEYIGLEPDAPQGFGNFLGEHIFRKVDFKQVYYIRPFRTGMRALYPVTFRKNNRYYLHGNRRERTYRFQRSPCSRFQRQSLDESGRPCSSMQATTSARRLFSIT